MPNVYIIKVVTPEELLVFEVTPDTLVKELKKETSDKANLPCRQLCLAYCGRILNENLTLRDQNICNGRTLHCMLQNVPDIASGFANIPTDDYVQMQKYVYDQVSSNPQVINDFIECLCNKNGCGFYDVLNWHPVFKEFFQNDCALASMQSIIGGNSSASDKQPSSSSPAALNMNTKVCTETIKKFVEELGKNPTLLQDFMEMPHMREMMLYISKNFDQTVKDFTQHPAVSSNPDLKAAAVDFQKLLKEREIRDLLPYQFNDYGATVDSIENSSVTTSPDLTSDRSQSSKVSRTSKVTAKSKGSQSSPDSSKSHSKPSEYVHGNNKVHFSPSTPRNSVNDTWNLGNEKRSRKQKKRSKKEKQGVISNIQCVPDLDIKSSGAGSKVNIQFDTYPPQQNGSRSRSVQGRTLANNVLNARAHSVERQPRTNRVPVRCPYGSQPPEYIMPNQTFNKMPVGMARSSRSPHRRSQLPYCPYYVQSYNQMPSPKSPRSNLKRSQSCSISGRSSQRRSKSPSYEYSLRSFHSETSSCDSVSDESNFAEFKIRRYRSSGKSRNKNRSRSTSNHAISNGLKPPVPLRSIVRAPRSKNGSGSNGRHVQLPANMKVAVEKSSDNRSSNNNRRRSSSHDKQNKKPLREYKLVDLEPQLNRLARMGFKDREANIEALTQSEGYVKGAVKILERSH